MKNLIFFILFVFSLAACQNEEPQLHSNVDKKGSIETLISVKHNVGYDVLSTTYKIWVKDTLYKSIVRHDTIVPLDSIMVSDENGISTKTPTPYNLFISVQ